MSKKKFKGGLDSLLQNTLHQENNPLAKTVSIGLKSRPKTEHQKELEAKTNIDEKAAANHQKNKEEKVPEVIEKKQDNQSAEQLKMQLELYKQELFLWRTGKLNLEIFQESLKKRGLKFNASDNQIEPL